MAISRTYVNTFTFEIYIFFQFWRESRLYGIFIKNSRYPAAPRAKKADRQVACAPLSEKADQQAACAPRARSRAVRAAGKAARTGLPDDVKSPREKPPEGGKKD